MRRSHAIVLVSGGLLAAGAVAAMSVDRGPGSQTCSSDSTLTMNVTEAGPDIVDTAVAAGEFKTLVTAVQAADLVGALKSPGPFTVFAPNDAAFGKVPSSAIQNLLKPQNKADLQGLLTYHVVAGEFMAGDVINKSSMTTLNGQRLDIAVRDGKVFVDGAQVIATNIECENGVIHVIDSVVMPKGDNIVTTAQSAGQFETLIAAAKAAGLAGALSGDGPLTVFAPTDEAFAALPAGTVETLLRPENRGKLAEILKYHVVAGRVFSSDALSAQSAETLQGQRVRIGLENGQLRVNGANIIMNDIEASNGVIHVIDRVILPTS